MRIGLVIYGSLDTVSGGYLYDRRMVKFLRDQGESVDIFSLPPRAYGFSLLHNFSRAFFKQIKAARLDVLIEDELCHPSLFACNDRLRFLCPLVALTHHLKSDEDPAERWNPLYRSLEGRFLDSVDAHIVNSCTTRSRVQALAHGEINSVMALPAGNHSGPGLTPQAIRERAAAGGPLRLLFPGNLVPRKGLHTVVEAMTLVPESYCNLWVAGSLAMDPVYVKNIQSYISRKGLSGRVTFLGVLSPEHLAEQYAQSDLLVMPSFEGYGIVYVEGQAHGLPAIAATVGAAKEIIADGVNGFFVAPGDAEGLAKHLHALYNDRARLLALSLAAREAFHRHPTWEEGFANIHGFLRQLAH